MAEDNFTLTTFYTAWKAYQDRLAAALAPLSAEQLALRAAPGLRSVGENAAHIIGCRVGWFTETMGEAASTDVTEECAGNGSTSSRTGAGPRSHLAHDDRLSESLDSRRYATNFYRRLGWRAGSSCRAPGSSGMYLSTTYTTAVRSRSRSAYTGSRLNSPSETPYMSDWRGSFETSPCVGTPLAASV